MPEISFSIRAYSKIILHAAKYRHCAINGLLLAKQQTKNDSDSTELRIVDAVPLFHICLDITPMAEVALMLVEQVATSKGLILAGYYLANENINDLSTDRPAGRIADKIAENFNNAVMVVVDNHEVTLQMNSNPLRLYQFHDGKWKSKDQSDVNYDAAIMEPKIVSTLLKTNQYEVLIDFDNHLNDISMDWENKKLNKIIEETVEEYL